jgi:O-antigen/teichoic acid export membrane protein
MDVGRGIQEALNRGWRGSSASLAKRVLAGASIVAVSSAGVRLLGMLSAPILTSQLGPEPYGLMALLSTVISLTAMLGMLGIDMAYARFYFAPTNLASHAVERFCWRSALGWSLVVSGLTGVAGSIFLAEQMKMDGLVFWAASVIVFVSAVSTMAQTRRRLHGAYRRIAVGGFISGAMGVAATVAMAVWWRQDVWVFLIGGLLGPLGGVLMLGIPPPADLKKPSMLGANERRGIIRLGMAGAVTAPMYWVLSSNDRWFLQAHWDEANVGVYAFAYSIAATGLILHNALFLTWCPEAVRTHAEDVDTSPRLLGRMWGRLAVVLMCVWLMTAALGGDLLRLLADQRFHSGAVLVPWIAGGVLFYGIAGLANTGLLISGNMMPCAAWWLAGAGVNVILNCLCVPRWGPLGAAVVQCVSYAIIACGVMTVSQTRFLLDIPWRRLVGGALLTVGLGVVLSSPWDPSPLFSILLKCPVGLIACLCVMTLVMPDWVGRGLAILFSAIRQR